MRAAIKPVLDLDYPKKDGSTLRQHYIQLQRWDWLEAKTPVIPPAGQYLWERFWDIIGGKGAEEGFWSCLRAWSEMNQIKPSMWEVEVLMKLHNEYQKEVGALLRSNHG